VQSPLWRQARQGHREAQVEEREYAMVESRTYFLTRSNPFGNKILRGTHIVTREGVVTLFDNSDIVGVFNLAPGESLVENV
jgi:hypothetical protein